MSGCQDVLDCGLYKALLCLKMDKPPAERDQGAIIAVSLKLDVDHQTAVPHVGPTWSSGQQTETKGSAGVRLLLAFCKLGHERTEDSKMKRGQA